MFDRLSKEGLESFARLISNIPMIFYVLDREWTFLLSEGAGLKELGLKPGEVVGRNAKEMYKDYPAIIQAIEKAFHGETMKMNHYVGPLFFENYIVPLYDSQGKIEGVAGASFDASEKKRTEEELEKTLRFQNALINSIPGMLYMYSAEGKLKVWNKAHEKITGYSSEELLDRNLMDWYANDPESQIAVTRGLEKTVSEGFGEAEANLQCKDGRAIPFYFTACPLVVDGEDYFVGMGVDISSRKKAERELQELNKTLELKIQDRTDELEKVNAHLKNTNLDLIRTNDQLRQMQAYAIETEKMAALGGLVAGVAHEVNTPLGIGITASTYLKSLSGEFIEAIETNSVSKSQMIDYLEKIESSSLMIHKNLEKAGRLINSFKQLSIDQSDEPMRSLDLEEYLTEILFTLSPALKKTDIAINIDSPEEIRIITYPGAFSQIITNLIMNSINHGFDSGESGRIDISLREEEDFAVIDYRDNGKGMTKDVKSRIFEPFFTTRRNLGGTGLGLSVVYTLVTQKFQGSISCNSAPGKGTQFLLHLKSILT